MKKTIYSLIFIFGIILNINAQIPTDELVGYWSFSGNANDESGNGNNGTVSGATLTTDRFGNANSAYSFDGVDDKIFIGNNLLIQGEISISCWIKSDDDSGQIISSGNRNSYRIRKTIDGIDGFVYLSDDTDGHGGVVAASADNDIWNNVVMVYNGSALSFYLNGQLQDTQPATGDVFSNQTVYLNFGVYQYFSTNYNDWYKGDLDDVRFYNRALDLSEISELFNENICYQTITVTDTLIINANITGYNPITFQNTIKIYPNPTKDHIYIDTDINSTGYQIKIINTLSQVVYEETISQTQYYVDLSSWTGNGTYFVQFYNTDGNLIDVKKIIVQ